MTYSSYWDLSERERAALNHDQVEGFIDAELMRLGVLKVEPLTLEDPITVASPVGSFFGFKHGVSSLDVLFNSADDAQRFLELKPLIIGRDWARSFSAEFVEEVKEPEICMRQLYSRAERDTLRVTLDRNMAIKEENEKRTREHRVALDAQDQALAGMWADWYLCSTKAREMKRILDTLAEYNKITSDPEVAKTFLGKVFTADKIAEAMTWTDGA
jgi:hypothetical protein